MGSDSLYQHLVTRRTAVLALAVWCVAVHGASAQPDLAGSWAPRGNELTLGSGMPVDFTGMPLNEEGRLRALSYNESQLAMIERQCQGWPASYLAQGPFGLRIWSDLDPVKGGVRSWTIGAWEDKPVMKIWMDGRPHPSDYDLHTRSGFTTGSWDGNTLVARTTHMQAGLLRRVGVPLGDRATMTTRLSRHGDILAVLVVIEDADHLAEPLLLSKTFQVSPNAVPAVGPPCISTFEGVEPGASVPHFLPEKNPFVDEMTKKFGVPKDAVIGMPETLYPEYRKKMVGQKP
jgi:hypothetical protein